MTTFRMFSLALLLLCGSLIGCGGSANPTSADSPFVGHWQVEGFDITVAFNSKQRVQMDLPDGSSCVGTYTVDEDQQQVRIDYDPGQANCMSMTTAYSFPSGDVLDFGGMTTYRRLDTQDDSSI